MWSGIERRLPAHRVDALTTRLRGGGALLVGKSQMWIGILVRLNFFGHAKLCEEFGQSLHNDLGWYFPQGNGFWGPCRGTHDCQQITVASFCLWQWTRTNYDHWIVHQMLVQVSIGVFLHSDLVYQPFDTHDKFSQTLPCFFSILANRSAVGFYPQSCLHPSDH